jgi:hypothetical protein
VWTWEHAVETLITHGRPHHRLHQDKDAAYKALGRRHREVNHEWYNAGKLGNVWTAEEPFPAWLRRPILSFRDKYGELEAEKYMASLAHDCFDRLSDSMSSHERLCRQAFFAIVGLSPALLGNWAKVDVIRGRIHRMIDGQEVWDSAPELPGEYRRLASYIRTVLHRTPELRRLVESYFAGYRQ